MLTTSKAESVSKWQIIMKANKIKLKHNFLCKQCNEWNLKKPKECWKYKQKYDWKLNMDKINVHLKN